jgi:histidinol-phosphatase (PHP family)
MQLQQQLYETHMHTPLCKHAVGMPSEYAAMAARRGLAGITVTCHNPMPDGFAPHVRMSESELEDYVQLVQQTRDEWLGEIDVRLGIEVDYLPGYEEWLGRQLSSHPFEYVLGSVHPSLAEYKRGYWKNTPRETVETYFNLLATAAETGLFDCLSHPDVIKNDVAADWIPERYLPAICQALDRIATTGVAMELNTSGADKDIPEMNPFPAMLVEMRRRGIPVVIGADAHTPNRVADRFCSALRLLSRSGFSEVSLFFERERQSIPIEAALESMCGTSTAASNV